MHVAIPLYDGFTALDAVGPYTTLAYAPGVKVTFVAAGRGPVADDRGTLTITATATYAELPDPDVVLVPGGFGTFAALSDQALVGWIAAAGGQARWTTSVCSGSLLLGAAGLLKGRKATSHWAVLDHLTEYGAEPVSERVVVDGVQKVSDGATVVASLAPATVADAQPPRN